MKPEKTIYKRVYIAVYFAAAAALTLYILFRAAPYREKQANHIRDFSADWKTEAGEIVSLGDIRASDYDGVVTLEKALPFQMSDGDKLCFQTQNANVTVWIGKREIYRFESRENLTGMGYGVAFHTVRLSPLQAGQTLRLRLASSALNHSGGRIWRTYICPSADYVQMLIRERMLPCLLSLLIIFFGALILLVYLWLPDRNTVPYDGAALSVAALLLGVWCLNDTCIPQLLTGQLYVARVLDKTLLYLVPYPFICFIRSVTRLKRPIYRHISFWMSAFFFVTLFVLRYACGIDMINLNPFSYVFYALTFLLAVVILWDDAHNGRGRAELFWLHVGLGVFAACGVLDMLLYLTKLFISSMHGTFLRVGLVFFMALMLLQFLHWWSGEHAVIRRSRFLNQALQYAVSSGAPEDNIRALLEYLGSELHAKRTYLFEPQSDEVWHITYDWHSEDTEPRNPELLKLPYKGLIDVLYEQFKRTGRLIVNDCEKYRDKNPLFYDILRANHVERIVVGPLEMKGRLIGLFGVDNAPAESSSEIAEIIRLISYFFAQLVVQREEQGRLLRYSYCDSLTGARNRRAFGEFGERRDAKQGAFGYVMCDINGLKAANDNLGHEEGDRMIVDVAKALMDVFGDANVYRMGGDEFAAIGLEPDKAGFDADVARAKARIEELGRSASIGAVYCADGAKPLTEVMTEADALMYEAKKVYYQGRSDRRR